MAVPQIYTESITIYRNGSLDVNALKQSLREILRRHDIWRTSFEVSHGQLHMLIGELTEFPLKMFRLHQWPEDEREQEAARIGNAQAREPFDICHPPLVRASLVTFGDQQHRLYIDMHQIVTDGISAFQLLPTELALVYESLIAGNAPSLPELSLQFTDYATWQREWLQGPMLDAQLEYWQRSFAAPSRPLHWPNGDTRHLLETHRAKIEPFTLSWEDLDEFQAMRKRAGRSLFAALLAAFVTLLYGYSQQHEITLGTFAPCGRHRTEFQKLLGYFMNAVPLQFRLSASHTFRDLMLQAQEVISGAMSHGDVPFEYLARALAFKPLLHGYPLFQVGLSLAPSVAPLPPGWDMTSMNVESGAGRWGLYIVMSERKEHLMGRAQYNSDVYDRTTIINLLKAFRRLLQVAGSDPDLRLSDVMIAANIMDPEEPGERHGTAISAQSFY